MEKYKPMDAEYMDMPKNIKECFLKLVEEYAKDDGYGRAVLIQSMNKILDAYVGRLKIKDN